MKKLIWPAVASVGALLVLTGQDARAAGVPEASSTGQIDALLQEDRRYPPSDEFKAQANWSDPSIYARAEADPEAFWAEQAQAIDWFKPWDKVLEWNPPSAKWFVPDPR